MTDYRTVIAEYEALVDKARRLVGAIDYVSPESKIVALAVDGEVATLRWTDETAWPEMCEFPASALTLPEEQGEPFMIAYRDERRRQEIAEASRKRAEHEAQSEVSERAELARLQAKYEGGA